MFAVFVIPAMTALALVLLPYFRYGSDEVGNWFISAKGRRMGIMSAAAALVVIPAAVILDEYFIDFQSWLSGVPPEISNGLIPFTIVMTAIVGFYLLMKRRFEATKAEIVQTVFVLLFTAFIVLTVIGVWFRGAGMKLVWPL